jgi:hypothetical protein
MISADLRCILRGPMHLRVYVGVFYEEWSMPTGAAPTFDECNCLAVRSAVMLARIVKFPCDRGLNHARVALCRDETKRMGERYTKPAQDCIHHQPPPLKLPAHEAHVRAAVRSDPSASRFDRLVDLLRRCENHRSPIAHHARDRLSSESIDTPNSRRDLFSSCARKNFGRRRRDGR